MIRLLVPFLLLLSSCQSANENKNDSIERLDDAINSIIDKDVKIEVIADGFDWSEGPLWIEKEKMLLFSDIPKNTIYKWTEAKGKELYLTPSGYTDTIKRGGETGSNGLTLDNKGRLVLCQHGNRQIGLMNAPINSPKPEFTAIVNQYDAKRFNSPNDLVYDSKGNLYFTDPPYGLEKNMEDSSKELTFQGAYRVDATGKLSLLVDSITRPNGIALTPDEKRVIIANSDPQKPFWYMYEIGEDGALRNGKIFHDATAASKQAAGMPDGLKIDKTGNIYATGPGGIWIFNLEGKVLGKIKYPELVSNCALSPDEKTLYVTADDYLLRVRLRK